MDGHNRRWVRRPGAVLGVLLVVLAAGAIWLTRPTGPDVALALSLEEGRTYRYELQLGMDGATRVLGREVPIEVDIREVLAMRVLDSAPDGTMTIEADIEEISGSYGGLPLPPETESFPSMMFTVTPDGKVVTEDGLVFAAPTGAGSSSGPPVNQLFPLLPDHPVGPGDSWEINFRQPVPLGRGAVEVDTRSVFLGYHRAAGGQVAVIDTRLESPFDFQIDLSRVAELAGGLDDQTPVPDADSLGTIAYRGKMEGRQLAWVDPQGGEVVKASSTTDVELATRMVGGSGPGDPGLAFDFDFEGEMTMEMRRL